MPSLFVYGSLLTGEEAHGLIAPYVVARTPALARGELRSFGRFPGMRPGPGFVRGELCTLDHADLALPLVDAYEGYEGEGAPGNAYRRVEVPVLLADGREVPALLYLVERRGGEPVPDGDWRTFRKGRATVFATERAQAPPEALPAFLLPQRVTGFLWEVPLTALPKRPPPAVAVGLTLAPHLRSAVPLKAGRGPS
jgi:gamma-glutamylcyclotransferase (GGCT)/AIG2-like uncharacterized protein YtfP